MKNILKNLKSGWMSFAHKLARAQTVLIITIFYFLVISPFGFLMTIFGWDPLKKRGFNKSIKNQTDSTNWQPVNTHKDNVNGMNANDTGVSDMRRMS